AEEEEEDDDLLLAAAAALADPSPVVADPSAVVADSNPVSGFCPVSGSIWIYPTNYPVRGYQVRMARAALLGNTLVCLPTGLGKTFVAAVVMYNFYRGTQALSRRELWNTKRVLFLTPQIMVNDLSRGTCPAVEIKCVVIDEAHKALGNHAYCQVVRELSKYTDQFRVLALSATPGSDTKAVQQVISNLLIAQIELCAEDSPEIQPYCHERQVEKIVVPLGEELVEMQNAYIRVLEMFAGRLMKVGVLARRDIPTLTKYQLILARDQYRKNPPSQSTGLHQGIIEGDFALCISLYHGYELLLQMGLRSLFIYLCGIMDGSKGLTRTKNELGRNEGFTKLYQQLSDMFSDTSLPTANGNVYKSKTGFENQKEFIYSHPKLRKLEEIVIKHFKSWNKGCSGNTSVDTRVMIFSSFRDSVQEIAEMLSRLRPVVRVMTFVGHSTGKSTKGFTQKEQLEVVKRFREGGYNTLVSTCVGEEGLDIGEVDLIICFDAQKSPIRLVQRMGRTGRRRQGRIVVILAEGREERTYNQSQSNKRSIHKAIAGNKTLHFYQRSPRMIPAGVNPKMHKMFITAEKYEPSDSGMLSKERRSGQKQVRCHENWSLSPEEFEVWDRLYRIKESDGIKEPTLPQIQFETLENLEGISRRDEKATRELSLSEWRIWQTRPFPTAMVDHSDRCHHFVRVMEMMELLRQDEQGDCSYELEIRPHLRMEDVNLQRKGSRLPTTSSTPDQKACSSRKDVPRRSKVNAFLPVTDENESEFFSTFKTAKPKTPRRTSGLNWEVPVLATDANTSAPCSARIAVLDNADQGSQKDEELEVTFDLHEFMDLCDKSESTAVHESTALKGCNAADNACPALGTNHADSGYSSSTTEKSPAPDLFYLPESCADSFALVRPAEEPSWLKELCSPVKRFLSQSPPSWNELDDFADVQRKEEAIRPLQKVTPDSHSERLRDRGLPASSGADRSLLLFGNPDPKVTRELCPSVSSCFSKPASPSEAAAGTAGEELHWNDSFDAVFDSAEFTEIPKGAPTATHTLTNNPPNKSPVQEDKGLGMNTKTVVMDEGKSMHVFEGDRAGDTSGGNNRPLVQSCSAEGVARAVAERGSGRCPSEARCLQAGKTCEEQPIGGETTAVAVSGDSGVTEQLLDEDDDLYDCSQELFSVNFDLGFSFEECDSEVFEGDVSTHAAGRLSAALGTHARVTEAPLRVEVNTSPRGQNLGSSAVGALDSTKGRSDIPEGRTENLTGTNLHSPRVSPAEGTSSGSEEEIIFQRKNRKKKNVLQSPDVGTDSDFESPVRAIRKRRRPLNVVSALVAAEKRCRVVCVFIHLLFPQPLTVTACNEHPLDVFLFQKAARQFLDEEAELSQQEAHGVSSDESDDSGNELNSSLAQFLNDDAEVTQVLRDWEMTGVYLRSVRSPALGSRYKMVHREFSSAAVFSQIPEQDQSYAEDSFCVGEEDEEAWRNSESSEEELCVNFDLLNNESFVSGRKQYLTRRRTKSNQAGREESLSVPMQRKNPSRIIVLSDSSGEETSASTEKPVSTDRSRAGQEDAASAKASPSVSSAQHEGVAGAMGVHPAAGGWSEVLPRCEASAPEALDGHLARQAGSTRSPPAPTGCGSGKEDLRGPAQQRWDLPRSQVESSRTTTCGSTSVPPAPAAALEQDAPLCILADSREISSGAEVISSLKAVHGVQVRVCSLGSSDYVVSNRLAVERTLASELLGSASRHRVTRRLQRLRSVSERTCVIVEKDRTKPGETSRFLQRTQRYDGVLSALVQAGLRVLFSSCQEETAGLLKELAVLERRKNAAIRVPTEVEGRKRETLRFYLSIPDLGYLGALNMCHSFRSVRDAAN
ncbi:FANCM protein, partial [Rhynochetos jubatus]|nr:FANCM protein [Rhynochetos jubatus]